MTLCIEKTLISTIFKYLIKGVTISKTFMLKIIIQRLLQSYSKYLFLDLTKIKPLFITCTSKITFNVKHTCPAKCYLLYQTHH
jgi:hypothetical protein